MNVDDFPFDEIAANSSSEDELMENVQNAVSNASICMEILRVYVGLGLLSEDKLPISPILMGFKGTDYLDAGCIYAPSEPISYIWTQI